MVHRLLNIPLSKIAYEKELSIIKQLAVANGYNVNMIDQILHKKQTRIMIQKYLYPVFTHNTNKPWRKVLYVNKLSHKATQFVKNKFKCAFYTNNNLRKLIFNNKDPSNKMDSGGVYELGCKDCNIKYIGQTGRSISTRIQEHARAFRGQSGYSEMADHCIEYDHSMDVQGVKLLHSEYKGRKLNALETLEIQRYYRTGNIANVQIPPASPLLLPFPYIHHDTSPTPTPTTHPA
jgi:hypothetical protein